MVIIHNSLKVNILMLAAAVGCMSLHWGDASDKFADEARIAMDADFDRYLWEDDHYLSTSVYDFMLDPKKPDPCGCLLCTDGF